ncbi:MAG: chemotaxis protein CheW [Halarcobacter sp.]
MENINSNSTKQYLIFVLNNEKYATKADNVQEIVDFMNIRRVPKSNPCVKGITNVRGDLIAVVDPKIRFGIGSIDIQKRTSFIIFNILNNKKQTILSIALMVDMVIEVDDILPEDILQTPEFGSKIEQKYIENIIRFDDEYITVLDMDMVLNIPELSQIS